MGILNVTPDSFSEHGRNYPTATAVDAGLAMLAAGADIIDVGGESTRPGAAAVSAAEELRRTVPVIAALRAQTERPISIDTCKAEVARAALDHGADIVNDISGCRRDPAMIGVLQQSDAGCVLMHMRGTPETMQAETDYDDLLTDLNLYFKETLDWLAAAGIAAERLCLDPGIGFSKTVEQNLTLIRELGAFTVHGRPLLLGPSRKSFIGKILDLDDPGQRLWGTAAAVACGIAFGARIVRVHDVPEMHQVSQLSAAILYHGLP